VELFKLLLKQLLGLSLVPQGFFSAFACRQMPQRRAIQQQQFALLLRKPLVAQQTVGAQIADDFITVPQRGEAAPAPPQDVALEIHNVNVIPKRDTGFSDSVALKIDFDRVLGVAFIHRFAMNTGAERANDMLLFIIEEPQAEAVKPEFLAPLFHRLTAKRIEGL